MDIRFSGPIWYWRGPSPFHFVTVPENGSAMIASAAEMVTYGWGMIPATIRIGATSWYTALWPKDDGYIVPLKAEIRRKERLELDDVVEVTVTIDV